MITNTVTTAGFTISGTQIIDANGQPFLIRGINHAHTWYKADIASALKSIAATGANLVRIVLSNGTQWEKDDVESVRNILSLCERHQLIAMLEVHDATGSDNLQALQQAVSYWIELSAVLIGKEDRVIINIANEWFGSWSSYAWSVGYEFAITALREAGFEHLLVIDGAGYGQYPQSIIDYGQALLKSDRAARLAFSVHMYEYAAADTATIKRNIDEILALNLPLIIGEFGDRVPESHPVDIGMLLRYAEETAVGWIAWSWYGNGGSDTVLDLSSGPNGQFALTPWGKTAIDNEYGIGHTAELCSVFY
ncbi:MULTISPECIES: cellulase family glycosylhydrolase [unclassified Zymobacter]|uniref:cellulase family glycosylhydrolase n=1 Tax=unclassified Zymobacter TaxID=3048685 RepID=UPI0039C3A76E